MNKLSKMAFTLIELLVAIAIIGILSGLIVVTMSGVTQKANIARSQVFSNSLRNALMLNLVSEWKMDEGSGQAAIDSWNGVNNCTLGSTTSTDSNDPTWISSDCIYGKCLFFDGSDDYLNCGNNDSLSIGTFTLSWWMKPSAQLNASAGIISKKENSAGQWKIYVYQNSVRFTNAYTGSQAIMDPVLSYDWQYWTVAVDKYSFVSYKNGVKTTEGTMVAETIANNQNFYIGRAENAGDNTMRYFTGLVDDVKIYDVGTPPSSRIKEQYFAGLTSLMINGSISEEEYLSRINDYAKN